MKHALLRRSASLLLAIALIVGMIPAGIISAPAQAAGVSSVTYDFRSTSDANDTANASANFTDVTAYAGTRQWVYLSHTFGTFKRYADGDVFDTGNSYYVAGAENQWAAFKIKGLDAGSWNVFMNSYNGTITGITGLYLLPMSTISGASDVKAAIEAALNAGTGKIGAQDLSSSAWKTETKQFGSITTTSAVGDEHILVLRCEGKGNGTALRAFFNYVSFEKILPLGSVEANFGKVYVGNTLVPSYTWKNTGGVVIDGSAGTMEFTASSDQKVVLLGKDGKLYARGAGSAKISAKATLNGTTVNCSFDIVVNAAAAPAGKNQSYLLYTGAYTDTTTLSVNVPGAYDKFKAAGKYSMTESDYNSYCGWKDYGSERPFGLVSANTGRADTENDIFSNNASYMDIMGLSGDWVAIKVKVPAAGKYDVLVDAYCYASGGLMKLWMLPWKEVRHS